MKKLVIIGAGGHGKSVLEAASLLADFHVVGFLDDQYSNKKSVFGYPILGATKDLTALRERADWAIVAIGNNQFRKTITHELIRANFSIATIIHPNALISPSTKIGAGSTVMAGAILGTDSILGEGVIINCGAVVDHDCTLGRFSHLGVNTSMAGGSSIGDSAWLQAGSAIGYNVHVSAGAIIPPCTGLTEST